MKRKRNSMEEALREHMQAKSASHFSAELFALVMGPLIAEHYNVSCEVDKNIIACSFLNGQKFEITVEEIYECPYNAKREAEPPKSSNLSLSPSEKFTKLLH